MAALGSPENGIQEESNTALPSGSCPVCQMIADAVVRWIDDNVEWPPKPMRQVRLGRWEGFIERQQCECCQAVVQHMYSSTQFLKYEPQCPLILRVFEGNIQIKTVRFQRP